MKKSLIIIAIIVVIIVSTLTGVLGMHLGRKAEEKEGFSTGYEIGYDACMAKLTGDVWLVETTEKTIEIVDKYLDGKIDALAARVQIQVEAERYIGDQSELKTGCGELLRNGINAMYLGIELTRRSGVTAEEIAEYNAQLLKTRNTIAKHIGIAER